MKYRHLIEIQAPNYNTDMSISGYSTIAHAYADVEPRSTNDTILGDFILPNTSHTITMRYYRGITANHKIKWGDREFNIVGSPINVEERNIELILRCNEKVKVGN